ncbi:hypothetical protein OG21DRAFT_1528304 [Imleria badia]|nr:hypothetical protein OG21DRAFT_1528304 [Imleria badia]
MQGTRQVCKKVKLDVGERGASMRGCWVSSGLASTFYMPPASQLDVRGGIQMLVSFNPNQVNSTATLCLPGGDQLRPERHCDNGTYFGMPSSGHWQKLETRNQHGTAAISGSSPLMKYDYGAQCSRRASTIGYGFVFPVQTNQACNEYHIDAPYHQVDVDIRAPTWNGVAIDPWNPSEYI